MTGTLFPLEVSRENLSPGPFWSWKLPTVAGMQPLPPSPKPAMAGEILSVCSGPCPHIFCDSSASLALLRRPDQAHRTALWCSW